VGYSPKKSTMGWGIPKLAMEVETDLWLGIMIELDIKLGKCYRML